MELLERQSQLRELLAALERAGVVGRGGRAGPAGTTVLVSGEAGIGKTSLLTEFVDRVGGAARVFLGTCEALLTPRMLGPFRDMARDHGGAHPGLGADDRDAVIDALLDAMSGAGVPGRGAAGCVAGPTVVIIEDVHWADDASLDVIRYLARRVERLPAMLVLSYRDDEVADDHPLRRVVGALAGPAVLRIELPALTDDAVRALAASAGADPDPVLAVVGGNPFYLTEVLAAPGHGVPPSVRHAVLARVASLPVATREALEQLAVVPTGAETWLVAELVDDPDALATAERRGIVVAAGGRVRFRHELARRVVELGTPLSLSVGLHRRVLRALAAAGADASLLVHHAVAAGDDRAVARYATAAAHEAAAVGGHRETAAFALLALRHPRWLDDADVARLHGLAASALRAVNQFGEAMTHANQAVRLWDAADATPYELGEALLVSSRLSTVLADPDAARASASRARIVLEPHGPSRALAQCYSTLGGLAAVMAHHEDAVSWAERALDLASRIGSQDVVARALCSRGIAMVALGRESGLADLERAVEVAELSRQGDCLAMASHNLAVIFLRFGHPDRTRRYLEIAEQAARDHALDAMRFPVEARWCHLLLWLGDWDEARLRLRALLAREADPGANLVLPLALLGRLLARRGGDAAEPATGGVGPGTGGAGPSAGGIRPGTGGVEPGRGEAGVMVEQAWKLALATGEQEKISVAGGARIEAAWLSGDDAAVHEVAAELLAVAAAPGHEFLRGEVLRYLRRVGAAVEPFPGCRPPAAAGIAGDWAWAAKLWAEAENPYEEALELTESPEPAVAMRGLETLDRLGAVPAAALVRRRLRGDGVRGIPRGPSAATRSNPGRLTARQLDVLVLLADGRTNAEIAARLYLSPRTVDNHVAAVFCRLGVGSRRAAVTRAAELGLVRTE